jgi:hypothetical protein
MYRSEFTAYLLLLPPDNYNSSIILHNLQVTTAHCKTPISSQTHCLFMASLMGILSNVSVLEHRSRAELCSRLGHAGSPDVCIVLLWKHVITSH